jgi:hypothetical protein
MQGWIWLVVVAAMGCGEVHGTQQDAFVPKDGPGNADAPGDTVTGDAAAVQASAALWLPLDDNPNDGVTDAAGTHVTTCTSCPTQVAGKVGSAYAFANNRLTVAAASDLEPGAAFTLALWVRVDSPPPASIGNAIIACKNLGDLDCSYALSVSPTLVPQFYSSSSTSPNMDGSVTLPLGTWHHLALSWDGTTKRIFFDGAPNTSGAATAIGSTAAGGMTIGQRQSTTMPLTFSGAVDELVFFTRALTDGEIAQLATP